MLDPHDTASGTLAARLKRQGLEAEDILIVRDLAALQAAVEACRVEGQGSPIVVLRARTVADEPIQAGDIRLDQANKLLKFAGREWLLRAKPVALLAVLMRNAGRIMPRDVLIRLVWGEFCPEHDATLRVYIHQLRRILDADSPRRRHIVTVRSSGGRGGYLFRP